MPEIRFDEWKETPLRDGLLAEVLGGTRSARGFLGDAIDHPETLGVAANQLFHEEVCAAATALAKV